MSRTPLEPGKAKVVLNMKVDPARIIKLKRIAFRRSVIQCTKYSQADFLEENIDNTRLPRKPTAAELAAYRERYPKAEHTEPTE